MSGNRVDTVKIQAEDFDVGVEINKMRNKTTGALGSFTGCVRDFNTPNDDNNINTLTLEHYPGMTEKTIASIIEQAKSRWDIYQSTVIHRIGELKPSDQIVLVVVSSAHRKDAFAACEFIMDFLKTQAPFWKKSMTDTKEQWVDAKESDQKSIDKWLD